MKKFFVSLGILGILWLLTGDLKAQTNTVKFFKDINYQNELGQLSPGIYSKEDLESNGITNDAISSLQISGLLRVTLFEDDNFGGKCVTYTASAQNVSDFNDKTSSIIIETFTTSTNIPVFFEKTDYRGRSMSLGNGLHDQNVLKRLGADTLSSLKAPSGLKVTLYENGDFTGDSISFNDDNNNLTDNGWDEKTSSIIVENTPVNTATAEFFKGSSYSGSHCEFGVGRYDTARLDKTDVGNDAINSVKVPSGLKVTLFTDNGFKGKCQFYTSDISLLPDDLRGKISSIVVEENKIGSSAIFYEEKGFEQKPRALGIGRYNVATLKTGDNQAGNDTISSLKVPLGLKVTLYENDNFRGKRRTFLEDTVWVGKYIDNKTSSIIIEEWADPDGTTFLFVADPQISGDNLPDYDKWDVAFSRIRDAADSLDRRLWPDMVNSQPTNLERAGFPIEPQFIIFGGDMVNYPVSDKMNKYKKYWDFKDNMGSSVRLFSYAGLGNHDLADGKGGMRDFLKSMNTNDDAPLKADQSDPDSLSYSWNIKGIHYQQYNRFGGDNVNNKRGDQYGKLQPDDPPYYNNNSLSWIEHDFSGIDNNMIILTFQHFQWNGTTYWTAEEQDQLWATLSSRQDRIVQFQGHSHRFDYTNKNNMKIIIGAKAGPQWDPVGFSWIYLVRITDSKMEVVELEMNTVMTQETPIDINFNRVGIFDLNSRPITPTLRINF